MKYQIKGITKFFKILQQSFNFFSISGINLLSKILAKWFIRFSQILTQSYGADFVRYIEIFDKRILL